MCGANSLCMIVQTPHSSTARASAFQAEDVGSIPSGGSIALS